MRCLRCHRELTDPVSIERGLGPVCWGRVQAEEAGCFEGWQVYQDDETPKAS